MQYGIETKPQIILTSTKLIAQIAPVVFEFHNHQHVEKRAEFAAWLFVTNWLKLQISMVFRASMGAKTVFLTHVYAQNVRHMIVVATVAHAGLLQPPDAGARDVG